MTAHLSEGGLRKFCRRLAGASLAVLLRRFRIERACALLRETGLPVKAVAERCGFADPAFFCRNFRRCVALSPAAYRRDGQGEVSGSASSWAHETRQEG